MTKHNPTHPVCATLSDETENIDCCPLENNESTEDESQNDGEYSPPATGSRRYMRGYLFHILYALEAHDYDASPESISQNLCTGFDVELPQDPDVIKMASSIAAQRNELDAIYEKFLQNWQPDRISITTRLILRFAVWELLNTQTDPRIVINEAIELAKCYAEIDAYRFINGILDGVRKKHCTSPDTDENNQPDESIKDPV